MNIVGLTGGIATGKTTVSDFLSTLNTPIIDADHINHQLLKPNQAGYLSILKLFPDTPVLTDTTLDKMYLRQIIFNNNANKVKLEKSLHPLIKNEILFQVSILKKQKNIPYCIIAIPLLIEAKFLHLVNEVWVTDCSEQLQIKRLMKRDNISLGDAKLIMSNQLSRAERLGYAHHIIETENADIMQNKIKQLNQQQIKLHSK